MCMIRFAPFFRYRLLILLRSRIATALPKRPAVAPRLTSASQTFIGNCAAV